MARSKLLLVLAGVLIVLSVLAGWIAIGRLAEATERGLARTQESLVEARDLASNTADAAVEMQRVVGVIGEGLSHTSDALAATRTVSTNLRHLLDIATSIGSVDNLTSSLKAAEVTIAEVETDLEEASGSVEEAGPVLGRAVDSLQAIPADLDRSIAQVEANASRVGQQVWLWRLAITAGGAALLLVLALIADVQRTLRGQREGVEPLGSQP